MDEKTKIITAKNIFAFIFFSKFERLVFKELTSKSIDSSLDLEFIKTYYKQLRKINMTSIGKQKL